MSTLTTIASGDLITNSRADINGNFSALNTDKEEISNKDTDTALTANSDTKYPSQRAVKAYVDAGGNVNASETTKGIVEEATDAEVAAGTATGGTGAKLFITPTKLLASSTSPIKSVTAGATINGATLPVPVYQNKTDNEFYACDGNDTAALKFVGFAVTNGTDGNSFNVQFSAVVPGFSALDEGEKYYLSDTVGTISTTPGTYEVLVGVAISTTQLLIQKGRRQASGNGGSVGTASSSLAVVTGFRPSIVRVYAKASSTNYVSNMVLVYANGAIAAVANCYNEGTASNVDNLARLWGDDAANYMAFTITSVTDTGFTVTWTESGTFPGAGNAYFMWEAEGEQ